jgi:ribosomal protein S8
MTKNILYFISFLKLHVSQKKVYGYILNTKANIKFLDYLWQTNFIWGYKICGEFFKVYFKYYLNKCSINTLEFYNSPIQVKELNLYCRQSPQSLLIIDTLEGYKSGAYCVKFNIGGILLLKIN